MPSSLVINVACLNTQIQSFPKATVGDRGIVESITKRPVKVMCLNERIKAQMLYGIANPFKMAYVVDVMVGTIRGRPALYTILAVHDAFERDD